MPSGRKADAASTRLGSSWAIVIYKEVAPTALLKSEMRSPVFLPLATHFLSSASQERRRQKRRGATVLGCGFSHRPGARSANWRRDSLGVVSAKGELHDQSEKIGTPGRRGLGSEFASLKSDY